MKSKYFKGLLLSFVVLSGCGKLYETNQEGQAVAKPLTKVRSISENEFTIKYIPEEAANKYSVLVSWPPFEGHVRLMKEKAILNEETTQESSFLIKDAEGGLEASFTVETYNPERGITKKFELTVKPPKDLVFSGTTILNSDLSNIAERIFLTDNSTIYLMNFNLDLKFSNLYLGSNSKIQSFPDGAKASMSQSGRSSGNLKLEGKSIVGNLTLKMNSEAGGDGYVGEVMCRGGWMIRKCNGGPGGNSGALAVFQIQIEDWSSFTLNPFFERSPGGQLGNQYSGDLNGICSREPTNSDRLFKICDIVPTNGTPATGGAICTKLGTGGNYECKN